MIVALASVADCGNVQWYRTAQDTADRLTDKGTVTFGDDFSQNVVVEVKR